jgi:hypothetical protein
MVCFSYAAYGADGFNENLGLVAMEYVVVIGFALWELTRTMKHDSFAKGAKT